MILPPHDWWLLSSCLLHIELVVSLHIQVKYCLFHLPQKKSQDPNRFNDRGGQLQKQLKLRKQLEKELPKLEKELKASLLQWEEDHERYFIVHDSHYLDALELEVMERLSTREKEKIKKVWYIIVVSFKSAGFSTLTLGDAILLYIVQVNNSQH